jgi:hypothetical protein
MWLPLVHLKTFRITNAQNVLDFVAYLEMVLVLLTIFNFDEFFRSWKLNGDVPWNFGQNKMLQMYGNGKRMANFKNIVQNKVNLWEFSSINFVIWPEFWTFWSKFNARLVEKRSILRRYQIRHNCVPNITIFDCLPNIWLFSRIKVHVTIWKLPLKLEINRKFRIR